MGSIGLDLLSNVFVEMSEPLVRHTFDAHHRLLLLNAITFRLKSRCQRGGLSSLASQPTASVLKGSTTKLIFSMRWQVLHSNVRSSNPRSPGEIRANPILCLQVGHIGRSTMENEVRMSHPRLTIGVSALVGLPVARLSGKQFLA
jgi:hypothetical protein